MNLDQPQEQAAAAGEYVLGTLPAEERVEFERALKTRPALVRELRWWEARLSLLALRLAPVSPRPQVWFNLQRQVAPPARTRAPRRVVAWAWLATAASLFLAIALLRQLSLPPPAPQVVTERVEVPVASASLVAILQVPDSTMRWTVSITPDRHALAVRADGTPPADPAAHDTELWLITAAGPVSLGVIPMSGEARHELPAQLAFAAGGVIAVSLEPRGGSPTGAPTGPVLTTAAMLLAG